MPTPTYNAAVDYFGLAEATDNALSATASNENRSASTATGPNTYGDTVAVDKYGETAAPSVDYKLVAALTQAAMPALGTVYTAAGLPGPIVLGSLSISTQTGSEPTFSVSGQTVQTGATQLRSYELPAFSLTPRHRAQDFLGLCTISKGSGAASDIDDYGLDSVNASFPIEITLAQPKGETAAYDLHGGMATCDFSMSWYASTPPTIALTAAATALGAILSTPVGKSNPENGYTQYTWQVSFPFTGEEGSGN